MTSNSYTASRPSYARRGVSYKNQRGVSLIELMVSMVLALVISSALVTMYLSSRATSRLEEGMARVQEGGRFGMEFLGVDIRMAGYGGCKSDMDEGNVTFGQGNSVGCTGDVCNIGPPEAWANFDPDGLRAFRYTGGGTSNNLTDWTPALPADYFANGEVEPETDVIIIQRASDLTAFLNDDNPDNANIHVFSSGRLANEIVAGDILMVSDCQHADVFSATNVSEGGAKTTIAHSQGAENITNRLTHDYSDDAQLFLLLSRAYFIGEGASGEPALFRKEVRRGALETQELVEGVESMRVMIGVDTDATPDRIANVYQTPDLLTEDDWGGVTTVRAAVLVRTPTNVDPEINTHSFELVGDTVGPFNDKRRRHSFTATFQKRN